MAISSLLTSLTTRSMDELTGLPLAFGKKAAPKKQVDSQRLHSTKRASPPPALLVSVSRPPLNLALCGQRLIFGHCSLKMSRSRQVPSSRRQLHRLPRNRQRRGQRCRRGTEQMTLALTTPPCPSPMKSS